MRAALEQREPAERPTWHFLSNHALVLLAAVMNPDATIRELAEAVGVTERTTFRVLSDLETEGYLRRAGAGGRGGRFIVAEHAPLRHRLMRSTPTRRLIDLLETPDVATWRWSPASDETELSEGAYRLHGLVPGAEALSVDVLMRRAVFEGDRTRVREAIERAAVTGGIDLTYRVQLPDDSSRWIRVRGERQPPNDWLMGTFSDITREVQLEAARSSSEARLRVIFSESASPMFVFGSGIRLDRVNDAFARTLGRDQSELLGKRLEALVQADDVVRVRELTQQLTVETEVAMPACTLVAKRGRSVRCSIHLWLDGGTGADLSGIGIVYVTTERRASN